MLILDIFALRARSKEGKLQVELAQLKYLMPRLTGKGVAMSRLGGGIGTRGPGETKLETDRRHISRRMETLKSELAEVEQHRSMLRKRREKDGVITCAIVGYTNAGKSTLMNYLTDAGVLAQDKLFATLDPTSRALKLPSGVTVMMIDTVGLVRRLPHHLVEAFRSTLEEAALSDIILNVCDASSDEARVHMQVTTDLLNSLGCGDTPIITVLNKCDLLEEESFPQEIWFLSLAAAGDLEQSCAAVTAGGACADVVSLLMMTAMYTLDRRKYRRGGDTVPHLTRRMLAVALPLAVSAYARTSLTTLEHLLIPRGLKSAGLTADRALAGYGIVHGMALPVVLFPS